MKNKMILLILATMTLGACKHNESNTGNPFFADYGTPYNIPPFDKIMNKHYIPAFEEGMKQQAEAVKAIVENTETPTFANTIEALENSGDLLGKVSSVFFNLTEAHTNDSLQDIAEIVSGKLSKHSDDINLNPVLFAKVKEVYEQKENLGLNDEQMRLLDKTFKRFVRGGANLPADQQERFRQINEELSKLSLRFGKNLLDENNAFTLVIDNPQDLKGLPASIADAAAAEAKAANMEGKWLFTMDKPSWIPFITYADNRDLREKIYKGWMMRGNNNNGSDNKEVVAKITTLRAERARMLGFDTHADFILDVNMAKKPAAVYELLHNLWTPALAKAQNEAADMQKMIDAEGGNFKLASWDWWYYAEKIRKQRFDLDEEMLRPYFPLDKVVEGVFYTSNRLYGLTFNERTDLPKYHPDVHTYEVKDVDGTLLGILFMDYHPRASKRGGAWCTSFREEKKENGERIIPLTSIVCNFSKPTGNTPALLNFDEVSTLFHEFGHGLHNLLNQCTYETTGNTPRDFVELPSQVMEHWAAEPEVLAVYAKHFETGEAIPANLIEKMEKSGTFNQGFTTVEFIAAAILDMDYHTITSGSVVEPGKFEQASMEKLGLIEQIIPRYRSTYFAHIFDGGYSAGYYGYIWAEVLDADAFKAFKETGDIFNQEKAKAFRTEILEKGGIYDAMEMYKKFRGHEPTIDALLENRGLK
ncbi:MAG: M3 family metallopeptidase [Bacteroidales bacterium]|nr:M3 family metallopeptidase [Bacteroidales bacterium]MDD3666591.1 M3 family metallopeptidase [Bacteroidales bacterium]